MRYDNLFSTVAMQEALEAGTKPHAVEGTRIRHSWAGKCSRALFYSVRGDTPSDPLTAQNFQTFRVGQVLHEEWQRMLQVQADKMGYEVEIEAKVHNVRTDSSGHVDAIAHVNGISEAIELKTINSFGYIKAVTGGGPRYSARLQGAVNATVAGAETSRVVYLPLEAVSAGQAARSGIPDEARTGYEWVDTEEQFKPLAEKEFDRWLWILDCVEKGNPPPRWIPDPELPPRSVVSNPKTGLTVNQEGQSANTWMCNYCEFQTKCMKEP